MPVTINGDGSITGLSVGGLGSGVVNTATLANGAVTKAKRTHQTGEVVQTQSFIYTATTQTYSGTNNVWNATPVTVQITPTSASNKILVMANLTAGNAAVGEGAAFKVMRSVNGGSYVETDSLGDAVGGITRGAVGGLYDQNLTTHTDHRSHQFVDNPATTLAIDYKIYCYLFDGSQQLLLNRPNTATAGEHITGSSSLIVMEIAS
jgi:hypothetical protein